MYVCVCVFICTCPLLISNKNLPSGQHRHLWSRQDMDCALNTRYHLPVGWALTHTVSWGQIWHFFWPQLQKCFYSIADFQFTQCWCVFFTIKSQCTRNDWCFISAFHSPCFLQFLSVLIDTIKYFPYFQCDKDLCLSFLLPCLVFSHIFQFH